MSKDTLNPGQLPPADIDRLKQQYGRIYCVEVEDDDSTIHCAYFRRPDMATMAAMTKMAKTDDIKASQILVDNTFVAGDTAIKSDPVLFIGAVGQLSHILSAVKATIKNV